MGQLQRIKPHVAFASALYLAVVGFYTVVVLQYPIVYIWATYEDLIGEWVQFWSIAVAFVISARLARTRWRFRWFFLLLSLSCFYVAMEEISWGQRIVDFSSPDFFRTNNLQGETNIHNFFTGPFGTGLKAALSYAMAISLALYGLVYPAMLRLRFRIALWFDRRGVASPPMYLWPFFLTAAFLECDPFGFNEAEIAEVLVGMGLMLTTTYYHFVRPESLEKSARRHKTTPSSATPFRAPLTGLARRFTLTTVIVFLFSASTTAVLYASPSKRMRIDRRIANGVEKFASRYARYERWDISAALYQRVLDQKPGRVSILRKLANCEKRMGNSTRAKRYIQRALEIDLAALKENPNRASVNRSLARTYLAIGDTKHAQKHLRKALRINLRRVKKHPHSPAAAYSLGKTYMLMERHGLAMEQLSRAFKMQPGSRKYRRAYYHAKKTVS